MKMNIVTKRCVIATRLRLKSVGLCALALVATPSAALVQSRLAAIVAAGGLFSFVNSFGPASAQTSEKETVDLTAFLKDRRLADGRHFLTNSSSGVGIYVDMKNGKVADVWFKGSDGKLVKGVRKPDKVVRERGAPDTCTKEVCHTDSATTTVHHADGTTSVVRTSSEICTNYDCSKDLTFDPFATPKKGDGSKKGH
jgi:hypothetical protein